MAMHLSIFSSEKTMPGRGYPWALLTAGLLIILIELALQMSEPAKLIRYGGGLGSYYEVLHTLEAGQIPDVVVLGSSRGREAVVAPELASTLSTEMKKSISVGNFSLPDGKADEILLIAEKIMSSENKPKAMVYFVSPRIFHGYGLDIFKREVLGKFPDQFGNKTEFWLASLSERPTWDLRNWIGQHYSTFRYRYRIRTQITAWIRQKNVASPIKGEFTDWQISSPSQSLVSAPFSEKGIKAYVNRLLDSDGHYPQSNLRWQALEKTIQLCQKNEVPVFLITSPMSPDLMAVLPTEVFSDFSLRMTELMENYGAYWTGLENLEVELTRADFLEHSHLNLAGSKKVTEAIARKIIIPEIGNTPP